jgi:hypothetical protein
VVAFLFGAIVAVAAFESSHSDRLREAKRRRLEQLELQSALHGIDTPPQITNEIEDIRRELGPAAADIEAVAESDKYMALFRSVMLLSSEIADLKRQVARQLWLVPVIIIVERVLTWLLS